MLNALIKSEKFNVTVFKRPTSTASFPNSVTVKEVDLSSVDAVTAALKGQDAVVSTVGIEGLSGQEILIKAAAAADVKRFLPSDYGCDLSNAKTAALPVFKHKIDAHNALREAAATKPDFTYSLVCSGAFLDWGLEHNFLLNWQESKPKLYDGGKNAFSTTTLDSIGQAVVGVLTHPEETKNRFIHVKDADISQTRLLELAKKADPGRTWEEPELPDTAELEESSWESLKKGDFSQPVFYAFLYRALFGPAEYGGRFAGDDNELLGIKGKTEADIEAMFKSFVKA